MSLRWDTSKCPNGPWKGDEGTDEDWAWLQSIIFMMPSAHMMELDPVEFEYRNHLLKRVGFYSDVVPRERLERWRGLTVNVVPLSRSSFHTMTWKNVISEVEFDLRRQRRG